MKYLSTKEFIHEMITGSIDLSDFLSKVYEEAIKLNKNNYIITFNPSFKKSARGKLLGIPVSVKDNLCTKDIRTTAGSKILENYFPLFDATCVKKIKKEGGNLLGKTSMDEFGFGTFSLTCYYGVPKNPIDKERTCGGSSGGAAGLTSALSYPSIALGVSTGGSISCPSAFCGVVGLTPTYGLVSRYGLIDFANSLDKVGVIAKDVYGARLGLDVIAGHDYRDQTSLPTRSLKEKVQFPKKAGVIKEYIEASTKWVRKAFFKSLKKIEKLGVELEEISLPKTKYALASYYILACAEASTNLAKFCGMRYGLSKKIRGKFNEYFSKVRGEGFGLEAKRRIMLGTYARMAGYRAKYYLKALKMRTLIIREFKKELRKNEVLLAPTMPILPPKLSEVEKLSPLEQYKLDVLTVPPNLAGLPHLSIPCGISRGMPVGMHFIADHYEEKKILKLGEKYEKL